jgi:hypothetical protein
MSAYVNDVVVEAYRKHLRRSPEPEGFTYWVGVVTGWIKEGKTAAEVETLLTDGFTGSVEYKAYATN